MYLLILYKDRCARVKLLVKKVPFFINLHVNGSLALAEIVRLVHLGVLVTVRSELDGGALVLHFDRLAISNGTSDVIRFETLFNVALKSWLKF